MKILSVIIILGVSSGSISWAVHNYRCEKIARVSRCAPQLAQISPLLPGSRMALVVLLGDSRIKNWRNPLLGEDVKVINLGVSGETTGETFCRLNENVLDLKPAWFIVQVGINDLVAASMAIGDARLEILAEALRNLKRIVSKLVTTGSKVIVLTVVPPISPGPLRRIVWGGGIEEATQQFSELIMAEMSRDVIVYDMKNIFYNSQLNSWKKEYSDGALHWNSLAYSSLAKEMSKIMESHRLE